MANVAILSYYSGLSDRGVETFAYEISKRLAKKHKITVFQSGSTTAQKYKIVKIKVYPSQPKSKVGFFSKFYLNWQSIRILLFTLLAFAKFYKKKIDVVIPLNGGWQTALCRIFSKFFRMKLLISGHAGVGADDTWNLLFRPDVFVALTQSELNWAQRLAPEVKSVLIPNGVDLNKFNPKVPPKDISLKKPIVICVSALVPYKRVDLTIRAVAKSNLSLLVLGDGQLKGTVDSLGKRLLGKNYLRLAVPYEEMPGYYRSAKVFTIASKTEAFGIAYVEAMACNLPVVTTNDESRAQIIGDAGILTNPENLQKYGRDLKIAAESRYDNIPYMQSLKFSWNKIAEKYLNLIDEVLNS